MPLQLARQFWAARKFEVHDAAVFPGPGGGAATGVADQGPHRQDIPGLGGDGDRCPRRGIRLLAEVGSGNHFQGTIAVGHWIEMDSECDHLLQDLLAGLQVRYTGLAGRFRETVILRVAFGGGIAGNGDGQILVPTQRPGSVGMLVEIETAYQSKSFAQNLPEEGQQRGLLPDAARHRNGCQQVAGRPGESLPRLDGIGMEFESITDLIAQSVDGFVADCLPEQGVALVGQKGQSVWPLG